MDGLTAGRYSKRIPARGRIRDKTKENKTATADLLVNFFRAIKYEGNENLMLHSPLLGKQL
jgi:hypothetical protein